MIIVSKEKDTIVNLDNVGAIGFKPNKDEEGKQINTTITAYLLGGTIDLGTYPTPERAEEVFSEMINSVSYSIYEMPQDI